MNALMKRIEKLEEANRPPPEVEALRIIRLVVSPEEGITANSKPSWTRIPWQPGQ